MPTEIKNDCKNLWFTVNLQYGHYVHSNFLSWNYHNDLIQLGNNPCNHGNQAQDEIEALQEELDNLNNDSVSEKSDQRLSEIKRKLEAVIATKVARISELEEEVEKLKSDRETAEKKMAELEGVIKEKEADNRHLRQQKSASVWKKVKVQARKAEEVHEYLSVFPSRSTCRQQLLNNTLQYIVVL